MRRLRLSLLLAGLLIASSVHAAEAPWILLFNGTNFDGWRIVALTNPALAIVEDGAMVLRQRTNTVEHTFVATAQTYRDFILELDLKDDPGFNSGILLRCVDAPADAKVRLNGYQVKIDNTPRAWTGGVFDDFGDSWRWLHDLAENEPGRAAFRLGEWARFRIECIGDTIKVWVNGVPTCHLVDGRYREGRIAFKIHSLRDRPNETRNVIRLKNIRIITEQPARYAQPMPLPPRRAPSAPGQYDKSKPQPAGLPQFMPSERTRLIILADMGNEPDEEQQMAHMFMCCNECEPEALIAVTGKYLRPESKNEYRRRLHPELFHRLIDGYAKVLPNLKVHAQGWPEADYLHSIVYEGQNGYGIADVGGGKSSPGSEAIVRALLKDDPRPVWVVVNAGANTLAQALTDLRGRFKDDPAKLDALVAKLRVFENGAQDNSGAWICHEFPKIRWIRSNYQTYAYGGPGGREGDVRNGLGPHFWKPYPYSTEGQHQWLKEHVQVGHGALGELYPDRRWGTTVGFMEGGGTVPWLGLVNRGLFNIDQPSWGGWSGRFTANKVENFWSRHADIKVDEVKVAPFYTHREASDVWTDPASGETFHGDYVPVWRWRPAVYADFICRMDWCVKPFKDANHHPVAAFNGDPSDTIVRRKARAAEVLEFDASASTDPDGDQLIIFWWQYEEAGTYPGRVFIEDAAAAKAKVHIPTGAGGKQIHIILEVRDQNSIASLHDYRRVVIDVENRIMVLDSVQKN